MCQAMEGNFKFTVSDNDKYYHPGRPARIVKTLEAPNETWRLSWMTRDNKPIQSDDLRCEEGVLKGTVEHQEELHDVQIWLVPGAARREIQAIIREKSGRGYRHHLSGEWHAEEQGAGQGES